MTIAPRAVATAAVGALLLAGASILALVLSMEVCLGSEDDPPRQGSARSVVCSGGDAIEIGFIYYVGVVTVVGLILLALAAVRGTRGRDLALSALLPPGLVLAVPLTLSLLPN